jgi:ubiquinone/menaquinone biosynthesis C-methylase UbiE
MKLKAKKINYKNLKIYKLARNLYYFFSNVILNFLLSFFPDAASRSYINMQKQYYEKCLKTFSNSKNLCVGWFKIQQSYSYQKYLLEHYSGRFNRALDFGCGMGRMMATMSDKFKFIDGVDLNKSNLIYAKKFLAEQKVSPKRYNLYLTDGLSVNIPQKNYDFIYSTIVLQHICVHKIRLNIIQDLYKILNTSGAMCLQFGFGYDNGTRYFDNFYGAKSTNGNNDVCIPDDSYLPMIKKEFSNIGFKKIKFEYKLSPHPQLGNRYHPIWLFIHLQK